MSEVQNFKIKPALFLDLDGTIRYSKSGEEFIKNSEDIAIFSDVEPVLWEYKNKGYLILGVTNQEGVAFGYKTELDVERESQAAMDLCGKVLFDMIVASYCHINGNVSPYNKSSLLRKPDYGMLAVLEHEYAKEGIFIDFDNSIFIGDRHEDRLCATRAGIAFQWAYQFFGRTITKEAS